MKKLMVLVLGFVSISALAGGGERLGSGPVDTGRCGSEKLVPSKTLNCKVTALTEAIPALDVGYIVTRANFAGCAVENQFGILITAQNGKIVSLQDEKNGEGILYSAGCGARNCFHGTRVSFYAGDFEHGSQGNIDIVKQTSSATTVIGNLLCK